MQEVHAHAGQKLRDIKPLLGRSGTALRCQDRPTLPRYVVFERRGFVLAGGLHGAHATARLYLLAGGTFPFGCSTNSTL